MEDAKNLFYADFEKFLLSDNDAKKANLLAVKFYEINDLIYNTLASEPLLLNFFESFLETVEKKHEQYSYLNRKEFQANCDEIIKLYKENLSLSIASFALLFEERNIVMSQKNRDYTYVFSAIKDLKQEQGFTLWELKGYLMNILQDLLNNNLNGDNKWLYSKLCNLTDSWENIKLNRTTLQNIFLERINDNSAKLASTLRQCSFTDFFFESLENHVATKNLQIKQTPLFNNVERLTCHRRKYQYLHNDRLAVYYLVFCRKLPNFLNIRKKIQTELFEKNYKLVQKIASMYKDKTTGGLDIEDLTQEGHIAMLKALHRYSPSENTNFTTFAYTVISNALNRTIDNKAKNIRIPIYLKNNKEKRNLLVEVSLNQPIRDTDDKKTKLADLIKVESNIEESILQKELKHLIKQSIKKLTREEQVYIMHKFSLDHEQFGIRPPDQNEIHSVIKQIKRPTQILKKIRNDLSKSW